MCRRMKDEGVCYECPHCGCTLKRFFSLKEHMLCVHARNEEKKHVCSMCGAAFALARRLRNHYACVHTAQIKVTVQPQSSSSDHRLVKSEVQILEGDRIKYKCPLCDRIYTSFSETKRHLKFTLVSASIRVLFVASVSLLKTDCPNIIVGCTR